MPTKFTHAYHITNRNLILLRGNDRFKFLQPLISNDLTPIESNQIIWCANLTPQGKFNHDLIIGQFQDIIIIETTTTEITNLLQSLQKFKLNDNIELAHAQEFKIFSLTPEKNPTEPQKNTIDYGYGLAFQDPRSLSLGYRFWGRDQDFNLLCQSNPIDLDKTDNLYHAKRIAAFVPENSQTEHPDLIRNKTLLLEAGFDALGGISWEKGCYVGQELTARTKYRGLVKKCLIGITSPEPFADDIVKDAEGSEVGDIRSRAITENGNHIALAGMRLGDLDKELFCGDQKLTLHVPNFLHKA